MSLVPVIVFTTPTKSPFPSLLPYQAVQAQSQNHCEGRIWVGAWGNCLAPELNADECIHPVRMPADVSEARMHSNSRHAGSNLNVVGRRGGLNH